jgi:hypothetical protein
MNELSLFLRSSAHHYRTSCNRNVLRVQHFSGQFSLGPTTRMEHYSVLRPQRRLAFPTFFYWMLAATRSIPLHSFVLSNNRLLCVRQRTTAVRTLLGSFSSSGDNNNKNNVDRQQLRVLLTGILNRSQKTISYISSSTTREGIDERADEQVLSNKSARDAATAILDGVLEVVKEGDEKIQSDNPPAADLNYSKNPNITTTALAHALWSHIIRPDVDTAIDATAGNGGDSIVLAKLLFTITEAPTKARLICMDIQKEACETTRERLTRILPEAVMKQQVEIVHGSHKDLPSLSSVALVVYNLGFLPGSRRSNKVRQVNEKEESYITTTTDTTLSSLSQAAQLLRVGGLLSVMTYPRTNPDEDNAVRAFFEGLALFSSDTTDWNEGFSLKQQAVVQTALESVWKGIGRNQKWRVQETKKLGWMDSPVLVTATRIQ